MPTIRCSLLLGVAVASTVARLAPLQLGSVPAVTVRGRGPATFVLLSGIVGGVAGYHRLEARLVDRGHRVIVIDPYLLSLDSADVTFGAIARRVNAVLVQLGVTDARLVGHAHGAGVMLRAAATCSQKISHLYFLDAGAVAANRSPILSASLRIIPWIARVPGGRSFIRERFLRGLRENAGRQDWLDTATQRAYTEPLLDGIGPAMALAIRLGQSSEPEPVTAIVERLRIPATVILGDAPHPAGPSVEEIAALAPLRDLLRIEHLPGVGHFPHEEAPDELLRLLLAPTAVVAHLGGAVR